RKWILKSGALQAGLSAGIRRRRVTAFILEGLHDFHHSNDDQNERPHLPKTEAIGKKVTQQEQHSQDNQNQRAHHWLFVSRERSRSTTPPQLKTTATRPRPGKGTNGRGPTKKNFLK